MKTTREALLTEANRLVNGDRNHTYGEPVDDYTKVAALWNAYLDGLVIKNGTHRLEPHDAIALMILLKVARLGNDPDHRDSWVDIAGYAACGHDTRVDALHRSAPQMPQAAPDEPPPTGPNGPNNPFPDGEPVQLVPSELLHGDVFHPLAPAVTAFQWTGSNNHELVDWLRTNDARATVSGSGIVNELHVNSVDGNVIVKPNDWFVLTADGELRSVTPEVFATAYAAKDL